MKTRVIAAAALLPLLLTVLLVLPSLFTGILFGVMAAIAAYELLYRTGFVRHVRLVAYSAVAAFLVALWSYFGTPHAWGLFGLLVFICALFGEMMHNHVKVRFEKVCMCFVAGLLVPYLLSSIVRILGTYMGRYTILIPFLLAFLPDSGAYFAGRFFGKHKLAPEISPKKTVEGAVGAVVVGIIGMVLYTFILDVAFKLEVDYAIALLYGLVGAAADIFGDLMFSAIKRETGVKDYGNLIPGHGGILDRFDSMMVVGPLTEALLLLIPVVA